jgi:hypothetical protein
MKLTPESRLRKLIKQPTILVQTPPEKPPESWLHRLLDPLSLFSVALAILAFLQWRVLEKTDETMKAQLRASTAAQRARISIGSISVTGGTKPDEP